MSKEAMWRLKGQLLEAGTRHYSLEKDYLGTFVDRQVGKIPKVKGAENDKAV